MREKKSIADAKAQAQEISARNPDVNVWVMDMPKRKAVVVYLEWVYRERVLDGWHTVAKYKAGKEI